MVRSLAVHGRAVHGLVVHGLVVAVGLAGCDGCEVEGEPSGLITQGTSTEETPATAITPDGYEVIRASSRERRRQARERELRDREREHLIMEPNAPDPQDGEFTLQQAVEGMDVDGQLVAEFTTELGTLYCDLEADRAPKTVANFIGLARGLRPWWDARAGEWRRRPYYNGLTFFRVLPDYMIQGGDYLEDGTGVVGYAIDDEIHPELREHDRAGQLCMANRGPDTNGAQILITDGPAEELDGSSPIFGQCQPAALVAQIARVPQDPDLDNRPLTDVKIERLRIRRIEGGAANAEPIPPQAPEGFDPSVTPRGASEGPSLQRQRLEERRRVRERLEALRMGGGGGHFGNDHAGHNH
ncbi:MAG: peptidylprolyl isomerase [Myxococcota bacterium]